MRGGVHAFLLTALGREKNSAVPLWGSGKRARSWGKRARFVRATCFHRCKAQGRWWGGGEATGERAIGFLRFSSVQNETSSRVWVHNWGHASQAIASFSFGLDKIEPSMKKIQVSIEVGGGVNGGGKRFGACLLWYQLMDACALAVLSQPSLARWAIVVNHPLKIIPRTEQTVATDKGDALCLVAFPPPAPAHAPLKLPLIALSSFHIQSHSRCGQRPLVVALALHGFWEGVSPVLPSPPPPRQKREKKITA